MRDSQALMAWKLSARAMMVSSCSVGSSASLGIGTLLAEPATSDCSQTGEVDVEVKEELELGNLECPRSEKVGVGGAELSDAIQYEYGDWKEDSALAVTSSVEERPQVLVANLSGIGLRILNAIVA